MLGLGGNEQIRIFGGSASTKFVKKMCDYLGCPVGDNTTLVFSEGNTFVRINESVRDKDVYLVQTIGLNPNNEFMELVFYIDALKRASANSVTVIMPYFSYAKGDKKDEPRVSIRGRVCADMLEKAGADRVLTMDLHAAQVQGFFTKPVDHLYAQPLLAAYARHAGIGDLAETLPGADVRQVHLHRRERHGLERVENGDARVCVRRGIDDDAVHPSESGLDGIDDRALVVGLEKLAFCADLPAGRADICLERGKVTLSVKLRFPHAEKVQIGTVDDEDLHKITLRMSSTVSSSARLLSMI